MRKGSSVKLTPDELLSTIKRSTLPTLLVEGDDDIIIFRKLEETYVNISLSLLNTGGRSGLLKVFERRDEITDVKLGFIADRDSWSIEGIPEKYICSNIIFTSGYSIENDLFSDGDLLNLISKDRRAAFLFDLDRLVECFALSLNRFICGEASELNLNTIALLDSPAVRQQLLELKAGEIYPEDLKIRIRENYITLLRGKNLLQLTLRHLSENGASLYKALGLMQMIAHKQGPAITRIFDAVALLFAPMHLIPPSNLFTATVVDDLMQK